MYYGRETSLHQCSKLNIDSNLILKSCPTSDTLIEKHIVDSQGFSLVNTIQKRNTYISMINQNSSKDFGEIPSQSRSNIQSRVTYRKGKIFMQKNGQKNITKAKISNLQPLVSRPVKKIKQKKRKMSEPLLFHGTNIDGDQISEIQFFQQNENKRFHDQSYSQLKKNGQQIETQVLILKDLEESEQKETIILNQKDNLGNKIVVFLLFTLVLVILGAKVI